MDGRRSVIPSDTSDPVFSPPSTPIFDIEEEDEEEDDEDDEENIEPLSAEDLLIPDDMRKREDGYKSLKRRIYPEEMPDYECKQLDICEHSGAGCAMKGQRTWELPHYCKTVKVKIAWRKVSVSSQERKTGRRLNDTLH